MEYLIQTLHNLSSITMQISLEHGITLELIQKHHAPSIFKMVNENRAHLSQWLPFVDQMQTLDFAEKFVTGSMDRNKAGIEFAFVIYVNNSLIGRIGVYKIDNQNKIGEIGYWIIKSEQGKGIITNCCEEIIRFCFETIKLNRIEIKCGTDNLKSKKIPERLNFKFEGIIRNGEFMHDKFIDLNLYSLLHSEWKKL